MGTNLLQSHENQFTTDSQSCRHRMLELYRHKLINNGCSIPAWLSSELMPAETIGNSTPGPSSGDHVSHPNGHADLRGDQRGGAHPQSEHTSQGEGPFDESRKTSLSTSSGSNAALQSACGGRPQEQSSRPMDSLCNLRPAAELHPATRTLRDERTKPKSEHHPESSDLVATHASERQAVLGHREGHDRQGRCRGEAQQHGYGSAEQAGHQLRRGGQPQVEKQQELRQGVLDNQLGGGRSVLTSHGSPRYGELPHRAGAHGDPRCDPESQEICGDQPGVTPGLI